MLAGQIIAAIGYALRLQPRKMRHGLAGIKVTLGDIDTRATGGLQIGSKIGDIIVKARRLLHWRAAADIDFSA